MGERTLNIVKLFLSHLLPVPILVGCSFLISNGNLMILCIGQTVLVIVFLAGYWEFLGLRFRLVFTILCELLIIAAVTEAVISGKPVFPAAKWFIFLLVVQIWLWYVLIKMLIVIFKNDHEVYDMEFPFRDGRYMVTDGGDSYISRLMNYHYHSRMHKKKGTNKSMFYATDIVKLAEHHTSIMPPENEDYPIFGEVMHAPMDGTIFRVINDIDDNLPFSGGYPYNTGNTVVIRKDSLYFLLGHMKKGSITMKEGQQVHRGERIGEAGNSGMSERPHLHMQLMRSETGDYWKGMGICIRWEGRNLFKNRIVKR